MGSYAGVIESYQASLGQIGSKLNGAMATPLMLNMKRNKIRRKLKSAVQKILTDNKTINLNYTYVVFGKAKAYEEKYSAILDKVQNTFKRIK